RFPKRGRRGPPEPDEPVHPVLGSVPAALRRGEHIRHENAAARRNAAPAQQASDTGQFVWEVLANIYRRRRVGAQHVPRPPPLAIEEKRGMPAQTYDFRDIGMRAVDLRGPRAGADDPAWLTEPAMQDLQQRAEHD